MQSITAATLRVTSVLAVAMLLGAAAPDGMDVQITDVGPLARAERQPAKVLAFQNTMYQAAPIPDEDAAPPPTAVRTEAQLAPKMLAPHSLFQGDGYSNGSSQEAGLERRKAAAAGLGLSVPVD